jgi:hypothetical protein
MCTLKAKKCQKQKLSLLHPDKQTVKKGEESFCRAIIISHVAG